MTAFPSTVYRCPGPHHGLPGTTYESRGVADEAQLAARLADGWFATLPEAAEAFLNPPAPAPGAAPAPAIVEAVVGEIVEPDDDAPPTRAEMVEQAERLGIRVDRRWSDARLLAKINDAMIERQAPPADPALAAWPADEDPI